MTRFADASRADGEPCGRDGFPLSREAWEVLASSLHLSERELDIVRGIFDGGAEADIACDLDVSVHTIHSHLDRMYRKLHVGNRCALVVRIFSTYLIMESQGLISVQHCPSALSTVPPEQANAEALSPVQLTAK
jgi:DNA-binding CsgD family transcriptional regulator